MDRLLISESSRKNITDLSCDTCKHVDGDGGPARQHAVVPLLRQPQRGRGTPAHRRAITSASQSNTPWSIFPWTPRRVPNSRGLRRPCRAVALPDERGDTMQILLDAVPTTCKRPWPALASRRPLAPGHWPRQERKEGDVALPCFPCQDGRTRSCGHRRSRGRGHARSRGPVRGAGHERLPQPRRQPRLAGRATPRRGRAAERSRCARRRPCPDRAHQANPNGPFTSVAPATPSSATRWSV